MKKKGTPAVRVERSRWFAAAGAAVLLWSTWSYCIGGGIGLFVVTAVFSVLAVISKRNPPRRARWVIWLWVIGAVACMAANVTRLVPAEGDIGAGYIFDRIATSLFSFGLCSLFFISGRLQVSLIAVTSMPLVMLAFRERSDAALSPLQEQLIVWVFVLLIVVLDYVCRCTRPTELGGGIRISFKKGTARWLWLLLTLCTAYFVRIPVRSASYGLQRVAYGLSYGSRTKRKSPMNAGNGLYLSRPLPKGYRQRMRMLLLIDSRRVPGYLRENVFTKYRNGSWLKPESEGERIRAVDAGAVEEGEEMTFTLTGDTVRKAIDEWRIEVMNPKLLSSLCLPGGAIAISSQDPSPLINSNGVVTVDEEYALRYGVEIGAPYNFMAACQRSDGFSNPDYLDVPPKLSGAVSNWVVECGGLGNDHSVLESAVSVRHYFHKNFEYSNNVRMNRGPDPLIDFMKRRKGICVHFASAAALMFRSEGIPSRVVAGYVCMELNPWIRRFVTREREGHAWVEIWDEQQKRWVIVEPTPPAGVPANKERSGFMRLAMDSIISSWKRFVVWISKVNLLQVIAAAGAALLLFLFNFVLSPWGILLLSGVVGFVWWRRKRRRLKHTDEEQLRSELTALMHKIARHALPNHYQLQKAECWSVWLKRVKGQLPEDSYAQLSETVETYQLLRYSRRLDQKAAQEWLAKHKG